MQKILTAVAVFVIIIVGLIFLQSPTPTNTDTEGAKIAATIFPLYDITRNIAGDAMDVELILEPGVSAHTFEPSPSTIRQLQDVEVIYAIGYGIDDWSDDLLLSVDATKVIVDDNIDLRESTHLDEDHSEEQTDVDPHYWLSVPNAIFISQTIAMDLSLRFPEHASEFQANYDTYSTKLLDLHADILNTTKQIKNPNIITMHDAWYYFAEAYNLTIVGTFEPTAGREPTPQYLAELINSLKKADTSIIFSETQLSQSGIESFATDNDLTILELDPLGGSEDRNSYISLMKYNAGVISQNN